jgi:glycosyltransferase involved in cell wall biosynthesis
VKLVQQANQGVAAARNKGIEQATGDWIAFLDADDIWLAGKLASQCKQLQENPGVRMNYTAWQVWQSEDSSPSEAFVQHLQSISGDSQYWAGASGWIYPALLLDCVVWTSTVLAHRSVFEEVGNFDTGLRIGEDYDLWLRASRSTPILRVSQPLALYRAHASSITKSAPSKNYQGLVIQRALDRWALISPDGASASGAQVGRALARTWSNFADTSLAAGQMASAWHGGMMSIKTNWQQLTGWKVLVRIVLQFLAGTRAKRD